MKQTPFTQVAQASRPYNKALERTRRVGVPASRAVVGVPPCRSTPCSTGLCGEAQTAKAD